MLLLNLVLIARNKPRTPFFWGFNGVDGVAGVGVGDGCGWSGGGKGGWRYERDR